MNIGIIFPKDSEAIFDTASSKTFGGATVQMFVVAQEIVRQGVHDVVCFTPKIQQVSDIFAAWNFVEIFGDKIGILRGFLRLHKACRKLKIQVLIQHGLTPYSGMLALYCKLFKIKFVFMLAHDHDITLVCQNKSRAIFGDFLFLKSDLIITQNSYQRDSLQEKWGRESLVVKIGFPVVQNKIVKKNFILWIARCEDWKQPEIFVELARQMPQQQFVMICPKVSPEYFQKVKALAANIKNLKFFDFVSFRDTWKYFEDARVFVNTSKSEGFPQTFVQSVVCGTPIISLNVDPDNFISKYNCGIECRGDVHQLGRELGRVMNDHERWVELSRNALSYAQKNHNIEKSVRLLLKEIEKIS